MTTSPSALSHTLTLTLTVIPYPPMDADPTALALSLHILRLFGLSFTTLRRSSGGDFIPSHSPISLLLNTALAAAFAFLFSRLQPHSHVPNAMNVYFLYTKIMSFTLVLFSICGNLCNRNIGDLINRIRTVTKRAEPEVGSGWRALAPFLLYLGAITGVNLWTDSHVTLRLGWTFRLVHYVCFWYTTLLTGEFVLAMRYVREGFLCLGGALGREDVKGWMEGWMELREVEDLVNEVFGKQIFLTQVLAISSAIVNVYYMIRMNMYCTTCLWVNMMILIGLFQCVVVTVVSTWAAEAAAGAANRVNEIIFNRLAQWKDPKIYNQVKYFILFNYHHPIEFRVWLFYAITYESLFKVILTSSAVTTIILQCDLLRGSV